MIIDFHTHVFPDQIAPKTIPHLAKVSGIPAHTDGTIQGLLQSMEASGVDLSIVLPVVTKPSQFDSINAFAKRINENYEGRLLSFGGIHPDCEDYKEKLKLIKDMGLLGIKLHPDYQGVMIDDLRYMNIMDYASQLGLITVIHAGIDIGLPEPVHCPPDKTRKVLDEIKPEKVILAHLGGWGQWEAVYDYLAGEPVYLDTAFLFDYMDQDVFMKIWEKHDKDKILFASDSPWSDVAKGIAWIKQLPLTEEERKAVFVENGKNLLNLK